MGQIRHSLNSVHLSLDVDTNQVVTIHILYLALNDLLLSLEQIRYDLGHTGCDLGVLTLDFLRFEVDPKVQLRHARSAYLPIRGARSKLNEGRHASF